jgi:hypothetical protein
MIAGIIYPGYTYYTLNFAQLATTNYSQLEPCLLG